VCVEVQEYGKESSVKVSFTTLKELEEYQESRFRRLLLNVEENAERQVDALGSVHGHVVLC